MMMILMTTMVLCIRVSLLMTTSAAYLHSHYQVQASYELLGYDQQILSLGLSRKLMVHQKVEGYGDQDLVSYNDHKGTLLDGPQKMEDEAVVHGAKGSDPTRFITMDYSHVRRRRPVHNKSFPKAIPSP